MQWFVFGLTYFQKLLPLKGFNYGYMTSKWQKANVTIGPMICSGGVLNLFLNLNQFIFEVYLILQLVKLSAMELG